MKIWWQRYKHATLAAVLILYWGFGFYPFQWETPLQVIDNGLSTTESHGLQFSGPGIAFTRAAPQWLKTAISRSSLKVDLVVRSTSTQQAGPARIMTISRDTLLRNLTVGQVGADLIVRIRTPDTNQNGLPSYRIKGVFAEPGWHRITTNILPERLIVRVDDNTALSIRLPKGALSGWSPAYRLALGNELTFNRPWLGHIRQASIAVGTWNIDYTNENTLYAPQRLNILKAHYVLIPFIGKTISPGFLSDFFVNLLGFMPLGILLMVISEQRLSVFSVTALSAVLSLSIELGQLFLSGRVTETEDLILNTLGGMLGAWLYKRNARSHDATATP